MSDTNGFFKAEIENRADTNALIGKLAATGHVDAVYSEPITAGDYTVITAAETGLGLGVGYGGGYGEGPDAAGGGGNGGGGGGSAFSRPVALIEIGPSGARVEPIVDPTKIAIAFFTTLGTMFLMGRKIRGK